MNLGDFGVNIKKLKQRSENSIINPMAVLATVIQFTVSFFTDRLFFNYWPIIKTSDLIRIIVFKTLFFIALFIIWQVILKLIDGVKNKNVNITWFRCAIGYFTILFISTLAVWPGLWESDEFHILAENISLHILIWQSLLSNVFYIISLMILPFPTGVVFIQIIIVSVIVGYVLSYIFREFKLSTTGKIIMWIPFGFMPVLYFAQAPVRLGLYSFLELLFVTMLYKLYKQTVWSTSEMIIAAILVSVLATWRTEGIYYIVIAPVLIWIFMKKDRRFKEKYIIYILVISILQFSIQNYMYHYSSEDSYEITAYINPIQEILGYAAINDDEYFSEISAEIDPVLDTDLLIKNNEKGMTGIASFWQGGVIKQYSKEDYRKFKRAYIKLIERYPLVFLKERLNTYWESDQFIRSTLDLHNRDDDWTVRFCNTYHMTESINPQIRYIIVKLIELDDNKLHKIVYHPFLPQLILFVILIVSMIQKKYKCTGILFLVLMRVPLVFITAPEKYFMYYFPTYLIGLVACACVLARLFTRPDKQEK